MPERRRSIVSYALAMSDSLIAGFDAADFREDITERKFLWFHHFLVNHPDGVKHILQDNAANYIKAKIVRPLLTPALGKRPRHQRGRGLAPGPHDHGTGLQRAERGGLCRHHCRRQ